MHALYKSPHALALAALLLFGAHVLWAWPGFTNVDTFNQYWQARNGPLRDWHPPIMAALWRILPFMQQGRKSMFLLQMACYWLAVLLLGGAVMRWRRRCGWLVLALAVMPPQLWLVAEVAKDAHMAISLLLAFALLLHYRLQAKKIPLWAGGIISLFLGYGLLVRYNAPFAVIPLAIYALRPGWCARPYGFAAACMLALPASLLFSDAVNHRVLSAVRENPSHGLLIYDIAGTGYYSGDAALVGNGVTSARLEECYHPTTSDTLRECDDIWSQVPSPHLADTWRAAVLAHPLAYLQHRAAHFNYAIAFAVGFNSNSPYAFMPEIARRDDLPLPAKLSLRQWLLLPLTAPAFALLLGAVLGALLWPRRQQPLPQATLLLLLSAGGYSCAYFFVSVAPWLRYQCWPLLAIYLAVPMYLAGRQQQCVSRAERVAVVAIVLFALLLLGLHIAIGDATKP